MYDVAYRDEAVAWAKELVWREASGPGDVEPAMHRLGARYRIPFATLWALRYRPPKDVMTSVYFRVKAAWEDARQRQLRALQDDIKITAAVAGPDTRAVRSAVALVDEALRSELTPPGPGPA